MTSAASCHTKAPEGRFWQITVTTFSIQNSAEFIRQLNLWIKQNPTSRLASVNHAFSTNEVYNLVLRESTLLTAGNVRKRKYTEDGEYGATMFPTLHLIRRYVARSGNLWTNHKVRTAARATISNFCARMDESKFKSTMLVLPLIKQCHTTRGRNIENKVILLAIFIVIFL